MVLQDCLYGIGCCYCTAFQMIALLCGYLEVGSMLLDGYCGTTLVQYTVFIYVFLITSGVILLMV